ncbi:MAG: hypothetical protein ABI461_18040 [Polyangiaceae bacterium]
MFLATGTGCAGCNDCFSCNFGGGNEGCNFSYSCDGGDCDWFGGDGGGSPCAFGRCDSGAITPSAPLVVGLKAPQGVVSDGVEIFYVDDGVLTQIDRDGSAPLVLATGVDASGGLVTDGVHVFWSGGWSGSSDGGSDAGDDADSATSDAGDAEDDAGDAGADGGDDAGAPTIIVNPGIYGVLVNGGDVEQIASLRTLPTFDLAGGTVYVRTALDDAGTSAIGTIALSGDGGFSALTTLSGNTENMHAFARRAYDIVALDENDLVSVLLDGGGKSVLELDAGSLGVLATSDAAVSVADAPFFMVQVLGQAVYSFSGFSGLLPGAMSSYGNAIYIVDQRDGTIYRYDVARAGSSLTAEITTGDSIAYLAADSANVYWLTPGPNGALYSATIR